MIISLIAHFEFELSSVRYQFITVDGRYTKGGPLTRSLTNKSRPTYQLTAVLPTLAQLGLPLAELRCDKLSKADATA